MLRSLGGGVLLLGLLMISGDRAVRSQEDPKITKARGEAAAASRDLLQARWTQFTAANKLRLVSEIAVPKDRPKPDERFLPAPEQRELARTSTAAFVEPTIIRSAAGVLNTTLVVDKAHLNIGSDPVFLRCYNGSLVGPTLRAKPGDVLKLTIDNRLPPNLPGSHPNNTLHDYNTTNLHTHGLHVSPSGTSDNVFLDILPGTKQDYEIKIPANHPAGTFWYHAHRHGSTAAQVSSGMSGTIVIEGGMGTLDTVPEIAACPERVLVLQQIPYFNHNLPEGIIEETVTADLFGPGSWNSSGRFTTVNGVVLPVITLRPGSIERWRMVDSGFRERIDLRLVKSAGTGPANLPFHTLAADGLPLGKLDSTNGLELWPGYRWDALVQAPNTTGEYLLIDEAVPAGSTMTGDGKNRKHIAKIVIEGNPKKMDLPASAALAGFRLPSIPAAQVTGAQTAVYGINVVGGKVQFQIDGKSYDPTAAPRTLKLNDVDEWTIRSVNGVGPVSHPFHIHVNSFEVISITNDATGANELAEPIWRDTLIIRPGRTIKFRTRYEDFTGDFVQHCHILDHEDLGMMERIRIVDPPKKNQPKPADKKENKKIHQPDTPLRKMSSAPRASVLFFVQGSTCRHCLTQLANAMTKLAGQAVDVTVVSASSEADSRGFPEMPFRLVADPDLRLFKQHNVDRNGPQHATIVRSAGGKELLRRVGDEPFMNLEEVVAVIRAAPRFVIEVRKTSETNDDYITWAPTICRIRMVDGQADGPDVQVTLTNDDPATTPDGGDVAFAATLAPGTTATATTLSLMLKQNGTPVDFFIAGTKASKLTTASLAQQGRDAAIEIHEGTATDPVAATHAVMVRVRKNASTLNPLERREYLSAVAAVKASGTYEKLVDLHTIATGRTLGANWPDQAHGSAGFLSWHRAFLLLYERELQKNHPHTALHYWREDQLSTVFQSDFLGANPVIDPEILVDVDFGPASANNPLFGWQIEGVALQRRSINRADVSWCRPEATVLAPTDYRSPTSNFSRGLENNPHNLGHGWVGGWMASCQTSPRDPVFFLFHCDIDRLWAKWQWTHNRFGTNGTNPKDYLPNDAYAVGSTTPLGHHLKDTMWPWDSVTGPGNAADPFDNRPPPGGPEGPFPASSMPGIWPAAPAKPNVHTMIDYLGFSGSGIDLGFGYDDVPYGKKAVVMMKEILEIPAAKMSLDDAITLGIDKKKPWAARVKALTALHSSLSIAQQKSLLNLLKDSTESDSLRRAALQSLVRTTHDGWVDTAIDVLTQPDQAGPALRTDLVFSLATVAQFSKSLPHDSSAVLKALRSLLNKDEDSTVRTAAFAALTGLEDSSTIDLLRKALQTKDATLIGRAQAAQSLATAQPGKNHDVLRPLLAVAETALVRRAALLSLGTDETSRQDRRKIAANVKESQAIREAAIRSLMHRDPQFLDLTTGLIRSGTESTSIRITALVALGVHVQTLKAKLDVAMLRLAKAELEMIETTDPMLRRQLELTVRILAAAIPSK